MFAKSFSAGPKVSKSSKKIRIQMLILEIECYYMGYYLSKSVENETRTFMYTGIIKTLSCLKQAL